MLANKRLQADGAALRASPRLSREAFGGPKPQTGGQHWGTPPHNSFVHVRGERTGRRRSPLSAPQGLTGGCRKRSYAQKPTLIQRSRGVVQLTRISAKDMNGMDVALEALAANLLGAAGEMVRAVHSAAGFPVYLV